MVRIIYARTDSLAAHQHWVCISLCVSPDSASAVPTLQSTEVSGGKLQLRPFNALQGWQRKIRIFKDGAGLRQNSPIQSRWFSRDMHLDLCKISKRLNVIN